MALQNVLCNPKSGLNKSKEVTEMLVSVLLLVASTVTLFLYASYARSLKQSEALLFNKGSIFGKHSRFVVCVKCGRAQMANGGYQECCRTRL